MPRPELVIYHHSSSAPGALTVHHFIVNRPDFTAKELEDAPIVVAPAGKTVEDLLMRPAPGGKRLRLPFAGFIYGPPSTVAHRMLYGDRPQLEARGFYPYHAFENADGTPLKRPIPGREGRGRVFAAKVYGYMAGRYPANLPVARDSLVTTPPMRQLLAKAGLYNPDPAHRYTVGQHAEAFRLLVEGGAKGEPGPRTGRGAKPGEVRYQDPFSEWWKE